MATPKTTPGKSTAAPAARPHQAEGAVRQMLQVTPKRDGFRRAGRAWHGTTHVGLDELTPTQFEQLTHEPMLITQLLEVPADTAADLAGDDAASAASN
ncbi:hypothetical protein SAMN05428957_10887 [Oryzisolibacter propanilivorax]|uniref:Uncharacterized protein n=1 Tax=Oryzisolibacter propanilivorax TaxID=1527607 RepID=A0A1G9UBE3_9BURK|nr:hypothetical protein [Oryzisolibacter propanilivorax]SDM57228.1 hypothetical protein SAMN05428957_10887 [Oryzisolibacter propanilivorax]